MEARKYISKIKPVLAQPSLGKQDIGLAEDLASKLKIPLIFAKLLVARGFTEEEEINKYLSPSLKDGLLPPSQILNLDSFCKQISASSKALNKIAICCDFDVDGLSSGAMLASFFEEIELETKVFVPNRFKQGYGLSTFLVDKAFSWGAKVLICLDFGTSNSTELDYAKSKGMTTIVIDHHHVNQNCSADIFINPCQKGCNFADATLCTAGLTWYAILALVRALEVNIDPKSYLDLAALGTVCDMVPLKGVNRVITKRGLELLGKTRRLGLMALKKILKIEDKVDSYHLGFQIGPRINAAGRMLSGDLVIELLTTKDSNRAMAIAKELDSLNRSRQEEEERMKREAMREIYSMQKLPLGLVVAKESFHTGVIGIVAQRLVENFYRPSVVLGVDEGGANKGEGNNKEGNSKEGSDKTDLAKGAFKGSVRGIRGFNVIQALQECSELLIGFGGHKAAAGLQIAPKNIDAFKVAFNKAVANQLKDADLQPKVHADTDAQISDLSIGVVAELEKLAPFGVGNPGPTLYLQDLQIQKYKVLKEKHLKLELRGKRGIIEGFIWNKSSHPVVSPEACVNLTAKATINEFMGKKSVQLNISSIAKAKNS